MKEFLSNAAQEIKPKRETNLVWFGIYYKEHAFWARESTEECGPIPNQNLDVCDRFGFEYKIDGKCMDRGLVGGVLDAAL